MKLDKQQIDAIKIATLRLKQAEWPDHDISVGVKTSTDLDGNVETVVTRSRKAD